MNPFRNPLLKRIKAVAKSAVDELVEIRDILKKEGKEITPTTICEKIFDLGARGGADGARSRRTPKQKATLNQCMSSFEGLVYYLEMDAYRRLGVLSPLRYWSFCNDVDEFVKMAGFPTQTKETKEANFRALDIADGPYREFL